MCDLAKYMTREALQRDKCPNHLSTADQIGIAFFDACQRAKISVEQNQCVTATNSFSVPPYQNSFKAHATPSLPILICYIYLLNHNPSINNQQRSVMVVSNTYTPSYHRPRPNNSTVVARICRSHQSKPLYSTDKAGVRFPVTEFYFCTLPMVLGRRGAGAGAQCGLGKTFLGVVGRCAGGNISRVEELCF
jgi:hypothetical protein